MAGETICNIEWCDNQSYIIHHLRGYDLDHKLFTLH